MATTIQLKFIKADAAPSTWVPNAVYFIKSNGYAESIVTATDGTPEEMGNSQMIEDVTANAGYLTATTLPPYPVIPADISEFNNDAGYITAVDIPPGFSGNYNDLTNTPVIPSKTSDLINDSGFIRANSTDLLTNKSGNISQWTNNSNYLTLGTLPSYPVVPSNVSAFSNDAGYITANSANALTNKSGNISQWANNAGYITANSADTLMNKTWQGTAIADSFIASAATWNAKANTTTASITQTANYTPVLGDASKLIIMNNAGAATVTMPPNSSVAYALGTLIHVIGINTGVVTIAGAGGVTVQSADGALSLRTLYSSATLYKAGTDTWYVWGDLI